MIRNAHVIGMGRLGRHLADRLDALGVVTTRWNRSPQSDTQLLTNWEADDVDAVFLAVSDDALGNIADTVAPQLSDATWLVHHAGSVPKSILGERERNAVLWPPMTFQSTAAPDWQTMPMAVDAADASFQTWARTLAPSAFEVTDLQRQHLHLGAVLLGNLTAAWIGTVEAHLRNMGLTPELLTPLVEASVSKALEGNALDTVTGPAARNDRDTLTAQQSLLANADPDVADLHQRLTQRILTHHGHDPLPPLQAAPRRD